MSGASGEAWRIAVEDLVWIHAAVISRYGGASGIRDSGALEAAVGRPYTSLGGREMFPEPLAKSAALMESVIQRHPFVDGNKRAGTTGAAYMLWRAGYRLTEVGNEELVQLAVSVAAHRIDTGGLGRWFKDHTSVVAGH